MDVHTIKMWVTLVGRGAARRTVGLLLDPARRLPNLPIASGKPSAADIFAGRCREIDSADFARSFTVEETPPETGGPLAHRPIRTVHLVLDTDDPRYSCRNNVVIGPRNTVLYEDSIPFQEMSVRVRLLETPRRVRGTVAYLSEAYPQNYYHWFIFALPRLHVYRERLGIDADVYYVGGPTAAFHREVLSRCGIGPDRVVSHAIIGDRLLADFHDRRGRLGATEGAMLAFSRRLYYEPKLPRRKLFIGRGATHLSRRRLVNEDECAQFAARRGFEIVAMEGLTVAEQARLFGDAACIIAPHGAALTNLLFAQPSARVLELLPARPSAVAPLNAPLLTAFSELSAFVGCRYDCVFGAPVSAHRHVRQSHADFFIPLDDFTTKVDALIGA